MYALSAARLAAIPLLKETKIAVLATAFAIDPTKDTDPKMSPTLLPFVPFEPFEPFVPFEPFKPFIPDILDILVSKE